MSKSVLKEEYKGVNTKHNKSELLIVIGLLVYVSNGFSYYDWGSIVQGLGLNVIIYGLILIAAISRRSYNTENFKGLVLLLTICPFFTIPVSYALYGQRFPDSFAALLPSFIWLFYFVLNRYRFRERNLILALLIFSIVILLIQIVQQFTYPNAVFGIRNDVFLNKMGYVNKAEIRNGLYRFLHHCNAYTTVPVMLFYLGLLKNKYTIGRMLIIMSMIVATYLSLTRQVIASCALVLFLSIMINNERKLNLKYFIIAILLFWGLYSYSDMLFAEFAETTKDNLDEDYVRVTEYIFFWDKICENFWTFVVGHGVAKSGEFLRLIQYWLYVLKLHPGDVGVIGIWFHYGIIYVLLYLYSLHQIIKFRKCIPTYIILFVLFSGLMSIMIFPFWIYPMQNFVWVILFYICDLHINKSPLRVKYQ